MLRWSASDSQLVLLGGERREGGLEVLDAPLQGVERLLVGLAAQLRDRRQGAGRRLMRILETRDHSRLRLRDEVLGARLHGGERVLEHAACVGEARGLLHAGERRIHRLFARHIGEADRREADDGHEGEHDQAGADREGGTETRQGHGALRGSWSGCKCPPSKR